MKVLGLDSTTDMASLGVITEDGMKGELNLYLHHRHSERLLLNIKHLLEEAQIAKKELTGLAVGLGPGSFTGLRIGVTTIKTMAQFLQIPVVGLSTLEILGASFYQMDGWLVPVIDARNKRVYTSLFRGGSLDMHKNRLWEDQALTIEELLAELKAHDPGGKFFLTGNGAGAYKKMFLDSSLKFIFPEQFNNYPRGGVAARLGQLYLKKGREDDYRKLAPVYLKQAHTSF